MAMSTPVNDPAIQTYNSETCNIGAPTRMENLPQAGGMAEEAAILIDFDAKQDGIGTTRRSPGAQHVVSRKTRAKPSDVGETEI